MDTPVAPTDRRLRTRLQDRLATLRTEQAHGQQALVALDQRRAALAETLLRISGAIQVLEECVAAEGEPPCPPA